MAKVQKPTHVVGVAVPPPDPRPYVPGITLPGNREVSFLCLHDQVQGFMMHWINNQHFPCPIDKSWCAGCKIGDTARWCGFIGVISLNTNNRFIARIPQACFRESGLFKDKSDGKLLTGCVFTSYRFGARHSKNNPCVIEMQESNNLYPRVKPFPLLSALSRWWNIDSCESVRTTPCPSKSALAEAKEFITFAEKLKAARAKGKGVQS